MSYSDGHVGDKGSIPVSALRKPTLSALSSSLNPLKVLPTDEGIPRDWRGLAHLIGVDGVEASQLVAIPDAIFVLINKWSAGSVSLLEKYLEMIDRFDVLEDIQELIRGDCKYHLENGQKSSVSTTSSILTNESDSLILTRDDVMRLDKGLEPQIYDAYVLYVDNDEDFAMQIVETLEEKYDLKICVRDRDLIGGIAFEHDAIMKLIAERCRRLIVVVSPSFLRSPANKFLVTFAQALGIDQRQRKLVPVLSQRCELPPELSYLFFLDYNRAGKLYNFWDKLRDSIQTPALTDRQSPVSERGQSVTTKSDVWISKTDFAEEVVEQATSSKSEEKKEEKSPKKQTVYKIIKNSFNKRKEEVLSSNNFLNMLTSDKSDVSFEQFSNSSSFESKKEVEVEKKSTEKKKKKWFKRKNVEPLMS